MLDLNIPKIPEGQISEEDQQQLIADVKEVGEQAKKELPQVTGLQIYNIMTHVGAASVGGTAEQIIKALELDVVKSGTLNRTVMRGAGNEEISR